jgi:hypothetical protein
MKSTNVIYSRVNCRFLQIEQLHACLAWNGLEQSDGSLNIVTQMIMIFMIEIADYGFNLRFQNHHRG